MKLSCHSCSKPCKDEAIKFGDKYYHLQCFSCKECGLRLSTLDFYTKDEEVFCQEDYRQLFGTKCKSCHEYIEGEVVTALGFVFHKNCFSCSSCCKILEPGNKVTFAMKNFLCTDCFDVDGAGEQAEPGESLVEVAQMHEIEKGSERPGKTESPTPGFGRFYNVSYLEHVTAAMKKVSSINTSESSPRHYHRPENFSYTKVAKDFIRPPKKESSILLNDLDSEIALISKATKATTNGMIGIAPMSNREPVRLAKLPDAQLKVKVEGVDAVVPGGGGDGGEGGNGVTLSVEGRPMESSCEKTDEEKGLSDDIIDGDGKEVGHRDDADATEGAVGFDKDYALNLDPLTGLRRQRSNPASTIYGTLGSMRTSLLNVLKQEEPVPIYPYEELKFSNFSLPFGVERSSVERHLSRGEFVKLFRMSPKEFYSLAEWKRNDLKKKVDLF